MLEVLPAGKNPTKQDGCVDRRNLGVPNSFACVYIGKVIEESTMSGQLLPQEAQAGYGPLARVGQRNIAAFLSNTEGSQPEARSRNTRHDSGVIRARVTSVLHHPGLRVALLPKVEEVCFLQLLQQRVIGR